MVDCNNCHKYHNQLIQEECSFCKQYLFQENIFCDLLRAEQGKKKDVECFAVKPYLKVIGEKNETPKINVCKKEIKTTDRQQWLKAYMLQQLKFNSDQILCNLKYHLCLVTNKREKSIKQITNYLSDTSVLLNNVSNSFSGKIHILCMGSDHVHFYIESPPDYSVDEIVNKIIHFFELNLKSQLPKIFSDNNIFQKSYFIESIG